MPRKFSEKWMSFMELLRLLEVDPVDLSPDDIAVSPRNF